MPEHVHEWKYTVEAFVNAPPITCYKCGCGAALGFVEAEAMLNAAERLSAEDADGMAIECEQGTYYFNGADGLKLRAYADTREGK